jgi:hypothetical protein
MGKASSAKKVARAARAGGSRRPGQRRNLGFPATIALVVVVGVALVLFARNQREADAQPRSQAHGADFDHWHVAYGLYQCSDFILADSPLTDAGSDALGIHTHGDGVIHIHPFLDSAAGRNAQLGIFFDDVGMSVSDSKITFPDGTEWDESSTKCGDKPGTIQIAIWYDAQDAADGEKPNEIVDHDFRSIRFRNDREYMTIAFVAAGTEIPVRPDVISDLNSLTDVVQAPGDTSSTTTGSTGTSDTTGTTAAGGSSTTATTAAGGSTTSTTSG